MLMDMNATAMPYSGLWAIQPAVAGIISRLPGNDSGSPSQHSSGFDNGLAVISLDGVLQKHAAEYYAVSSTLEVRAALRQAVENPAVRGIALKIESPGGQVAGIRELISELRNAATHKPVRAFVDDLAIAGAYWVATAAQSISATRLATVGGLGLFVAVEDSSRRLAKQGVKVHVIRAGEMKGAGVPGTKVTSEYLAHINAELVQPTYRQIVADLAHGRKLKNAEALTLADGRGWSAAKATQLRLIDRVESWEAFLDQFRKDVN